VTALDTNVLVRYLVQDDEEQASKASAVIEALTPDNPAFIACIVLCEIHWVLKGAYKVRKEESVSILKRILSVAAFDIEHLAACLSAVRRYEQGKADFSDYVIQEIAARKGYSVTVTFDQRAAQEDGFRLLS
jgi:predicted nucleic-acid-binding protein